MPDRPCRRHGVVRRRAAVHLTSLRVIWCLGMVILFPLGAGMVPPSYDVEDREFLVRFHAYRLSIRKLCSFP